MTFCDFCKQGNLLGLACDCRQIFFAIGKPEDWQKWPGWEGNFTHLGGDEGRLFAHIAEWVGEKNSRELEAEDDADDWELTVFLRRGQAGEIVEYTVSAQASVSFHFYALKEVGERAG